MQSARRRLYIIYFPIAFLSVETPKVNTNNAATKTHSAAAAMLLICLNGAFPFEFTQLGTHEQNTLKREHKNAVHTHRETECALRGLWAFKFKSWAALGRRKRIIK
jgi:hypothetical protein